MKKIISVILCLAIAFAVAVMPASAQAEEIKVIVANDLHYDMKAANAEKVSKHNSVSADFAHASVSLQHDYEAYAIIKAFLEKAAESDADCLFLPGDFSNDGTVAENQFIADLLREFEASTGKDVYVVPGNHDLFKTSYKEFAEIFADFGYGEAIAVDAASASYAADLEGGYRLLAIDTTDHGGSVHGINASRAQWIKAQAEAAKAQGKKTIVIMHHNLMEHFIFGNTIRDSAVINDDYPLGDIFAANGIKYVFTAHTHDHDIAAYVADDGNTVYEAVTGALSVYPCPYRVVTFGESVKFETALVDRIDTSLVPSGISEKAMSLMESDFTQYSKAYAETGLYQLMSNYTNASTLKSLLKLDKTEDAQMCEIIDKVGSKLHMAVQMPFYKAEEVTEGLSVESIIEKHNVTLPASEYDHMIELATEIYLAHVRGDEKYPAYSKEVVLLSRGLCAVLSYALGDVTAEEYAQVLNFVCELLGADIPADLIKYAGDGISRFKGIEIIVTTVMVPVIVEFTVDDAPADNNAVLPGYAQTQADIQEELTFWQKIEAFFIKIFEAIMSIFAFVG